MGFEYDEVIKIVVKTDQMNSDLKRAKEVFDKAIDDMSNVGVKARVEVREAVIDLNKLAREKERIEAKSREDAARAEARARQIEARLAERAAKERAANEVRAKSEAAKQEQEIDKALFRYRREYDKELSREEREIAKALHQYRRDMDREAHNLRMQQIREQALAQKQAAQFNSIFAPNGNPLPVKASAPALASKFNASAALRAGAGAAGALGAYPAAGALYASANAMQMLGIQTVTTTTALVGLAAAGPVLAGAGILLFGKEFNQELARMSTLLGNATDSTDVFAGKLDRAATSAIKLSAEFNIETTEVIKAFKEALSSGIDSEDLERFTRGAAQLATGLGVSLTESANILTGFKDSYQLSISQLTKANDILFNTVNYGKVNVEQLVTNFGRLLPIGKAAGISIEDLATGVAVLTRRGLTASQAVTAMTQVVNGLVSPSEKAQKALDAMGIATGDAAFSGRSLLQVVEEVRAATGGSGELLGQLFNEERAKRGISSLTDSIDLIKQVRVGIDETGTAAIASDRAMNTLWTNLGKSIAEITGPLKKFGSDLADSLNEALFYSPEHQATMKKHYDSAIKDYETFFKSYIDTGVTNKEKLTEIFNSSSMAEKKTVATNGGYGSKEIITNSKEAAIALEGAMNIVRDKAVEAVSAVSDAMNKMDIDARRFIENMAKVPNEVAKQSRIDDKQFSNRATDEQKQRLDDLKDELETKKELLEIEKQQQQIDVEKAISERKRVYLTPAKDKLEEAQRSGDIGAIIGAQKELQAAEQSVEEFVVKLRNSIEKADPFAPMVNQIIRINSQINTLQENVSNQDTRKERAEKEKSAKEVSDANIKDLQSFNEIVERLYREDTSNYEKAQKNRQAIFNRINKEIENESNKSMKLQAQIANNIMNNRAQMNSDDPGRQVRIGRQGRDAALDDLKDLSGKGENRNEFDAAVKKYQEASELIRNAMRNIDERRAGKVYEQDQIELAKLDQTFDSNFQDRKRLEGMSKSARDNSVSVRSAAELARDANKEVQINKQIEQVVVDVKVKMEVTGTLSEKSKTELADMVITKVQQAQKNRNLPSNYDKRTRDDSKVTSVDDQ